MKCVQALVAAGADINIQGEVSPMGTLFPFRFVVVCFQATCVCVCVCMCVCVCFFPLQSTTVIMIIMLMLITMLFLCFSCFNFLFSFLKVLMAVIIYLIFQGCYDADDGK